MKSRKFDNKEIRDFMKELYKKGYSMRDIARVLDCSASLVYHRLKDN